MPTVVVNAMTTEFDVYIGRDTSFKRVQRHQAYSPEPLERTIRQMGALGLFGNPFFMSDESERAAVCAKHKRDFWHKINNDPKFRAAAMMLEGKRLGCFCKKPDHEVACHGDTIKAWLEAGCPLKKDRQI